MLARWLIATALALIIPVGGWLAVTAAENKLEGDWIAALETEYGPIPAGDRSAVRLGVLCADPEAAAELGDACGDTRIFQALNLVIVGSLVLSGVLLVVSVAVIAASRGNRTRMAALFRPGLTFLLLGLCVLILAEGVIVVGASWELMLMIGRVFPFIILGVAIAVLAGVAGVLKALWAMLQPSTVEAPGLVLRRDDQPELFAEVDDIAARLGTEPPSVILAGLEPTFYVVEAEVESLSGRVRGKVLYLSVVVSRVLSRAELRAIIGHELGHFRGLDTAYSKAFAPVYAGGVTSLQALASAMSGWRGIAMIPAYKMLEAFFVSFAESERTIGRTRELEADAVGVEASSAQALGSSLLKLERTAGSWEAVFGDAVRAARTDQPTPNLADTFVERVRSVRPLRPLDDGPQRRDAHPFDTHPRIAERLEALGMDANALDDSTRDVDPADPAAALFGNREALETELCGLLGSRLQRRVRFVLAQEGGPAALAGPSETLRSVARTDTGIANLLGLFERTRDIDLTRPVRLEEPWVALADLRLAPGAMPETMRFRDDQMSPAHLDLLVVEGVADAEADPDRLLTRGTRLEPEGLNADELRVDGREIDLYRWRGTDGAPDRLVMVYGVGVATLDRQIAGLLVVPASDPLTNVLHDGHLAAVLARLAGGDAQRPTFAQ